jgi:hypothetical protein
LKRMLLFQDRFDSTFVSCYLDRYSFQLRGHAV